jgi:hypothetical protein
MLPFIDLLTCRSKSFGRGDKFPAIGLWFEDAPIVYPATSEKAVANHGLTKQVDARY